MSPAFILMVVFSHHLISLTRKHRSQYLNFIQPVLTQSLQIDLITNIIITHTLSDIFIRPGQGSVCAVPSFRIYLCYVIQLPFNMYFSTIPSLCRNIVFTAYCFWSPRIKFLCRYMEQCYTRKILIILVLVKY